MTPQIWEFLLCIGIVLSFCYCVGWLEKCRDIAMISVVAVLGLLWYAWHSWMAVVFQPKKGQDTSDVSFWIMLTRGMLTPHDLLCTGSWILLLHEDRDIISWSHASSLWGAGDSTNPTVDCLGALAPPAGDASFDREGYAGGASQWRWLWEGEAFNLVDLHRNASKFAKKSVLVRHVF